MRSRVGTGSRSNVGTDSSTQLLGEPNNADSNHFSQIADGAVPLMARRRRSRRRGSCRTRRSRRCGVERTRLTRLRPEQRSYLVERSDSLDGHGNDQLRRQLGQLVRWQLHLPGQRPRCHLPRGKQRLQCHAARECPGQRADNRPRGQDQPARVLSPDHIGLHGDAGRHPRRLRL